MAKDLNDYPPILDVSDIKCILNIGQRQAYELVNSGQFHIVRINRRIKIPRDGFFSWFNGMENSRGKLI